MTWYLVQGSGGHVYESNPVAGAWLESFGWAGLMVFKGLAILLVGGSALYISYHRPRVAGRVLVFACAVTAGVVLYSCYLSFLSARSVSVETSAGALADLQSLRLDREMHKQRAYQALVARLANDLAAGRRSLTDAVGELAATDKIQDGPWMRVLRRTYPGRSDAECLAIHLGCHALTRTGREADRRGALAARMEGEFRTAFGTEFRFNPEDPYGTWEAGG
jgi:hypothetical protein